MRRKISILLMLILMPLWVKAQKSKIDSIIYNFLTYRNEISKDILLVKSYKATFSSENTRYKSIVDSLCGGSINSNEKKNGIITKKNKNIRLISLKKKQSIVSQNKNKSDNEKRNLSSQSQMRLIVEINSFLKLCVNYYLISYSKYKTDHDAVWTTCVIKVNSENKIVEYFYVDSGVQ